jgi:iron-sulfur cluster repair protein YtfE (RIC family)
MDTTRASIEAEHRVIERHLDGLTEASPAELRDAYRRLRDHWAPHFEREEAEVFPQLARRAAATVLKMEEQHAWVRDLDATLSRLLEEEIPDPRDLDRILRQFAAILQHNMLEEERDLFGLLG